MSASNKLIFLRYPGGKQRHLTYFAHFLQKSENSPERYVEPFLGGGSVFFFVNPDNALLSDKNPELIDLYQGIRDFPEEVWAIYQKFPNTKRGYYSIRAWNPEDLDVPTKAARTLYLNRTCFKGMWRHNANGEFNVGYGGQDRRWSISELIIKDISNGWLIKSGGRNSIQQPHSNARIVIKIQLFPTIQIQALVRSAENPFT